MSLLSQVSPVNPERQVHENPSPCKLQSPPLRHGKEEHGSTAVIEKKKKNDFWEVRTGSNYRLSGNHIMIWKKTSLRYSINFDFNHRIRLSGSMSRYGLDEWMVFCLLLMMNMNETINNQS